MSNVICTICGATGESKCPVCRSVFPDDQFPAMWEVRQGDGEYGKRNGCDEIQLIFPYTVPFDGDRKATTEDKMKVVKTAWEQAQRMTLEQWMRAFCRHNWVFAPGCESTIGCGHKTGPSLATVMASSGPVPDVTTVRASDTAEDVQRRLGTNVPQTE